MLWVEVGNGRAGWPKEPFPNMFPTSTGKAGQWHTSPVPPRRGRFSIGMESRLSGPERPRVCRTGWGEDSHQRSRTVQRGFHLAERLADHSRLLRPARGLCHPACWLRTQSRPDHGARAATRRGHGRGRVHLLNQSPPTSSGSFLLLVPEIFAPVHESLLSRF